MIINPGELRKKIRIQKKKGGTNPKGQPTEVWEDVEATPERPEIIRRAKWVWLHGNEFYQAAAIQAETIATITIRYIPGITPEMTVLYKDNRYEIIPPIDNIREQNKWITFKVKIFEDG